MSDSTSAGALTIRLARPREADRLVEIENIADEQLIAWLRADDWPRVVADDDRIIDPGFVLVATEGDDTIIGFVHVAEVDESVAHLEQVSVLPSHGKRGYGRTLVEAAKQEASRRGFKVMTLRTFADVPWNAPFYETCGFAEAEPDDDFHRKLVQTEVGLGLDRQGKRVQMAVDLA